jgi:hypothetical protein
MFAHLSADPPRASAHRPDLTEGVDDVIVRALAKQPDGRFPHCTSFIHALRAAGGAVVTVRAPQPGLAPPMLTPPPAPVIPNTGPPKARDAVEKRFTDPREGRPDFWPLYWRYTLPTSLPIGALFGLAPLTASSQYDLIAGQFFGLIFSLLFGFVLTLLTQSTNRVERHVVPMGDEVSFKNTLDNGLAEHHYYALTISSGDFLQFES